MSRARTHGSVPQTVSGSSSCQGSRGGEREAVPNHQTLVAADVAVESFHRVPSWTTILVDSLLLCRQGDGFEATTTSLSPLAVYPLSCAGLKLDLFSGGEFKMHILVLFFPLLLYAFTPICGGGTAFLFYLLLQDATLLLSTNLYFFHLI